MNTKMLALVVLLLAACGCPGPSGEADPTRDAGTGLGSESTGASGGTDSGASGGTDSGARGATGTDSGATGTESGAGTTGAESGAGTTGTKGTKGTRGNVEPKAESIGSATMEEDRTIVLQLRAEDGAGSVGDALIRYPPTHLNYRQILDHLKGLEPGKTVPVPPWPEDR